MKDTSLLNFIKKLLADKRVKYIIVGVINTVLSLVVTYAIYMVAGYSVFIKDDIPYTVNLLATLVGDVVGLISSFFLNKYYTFKSKGNVFIEFIKFFAVWIVYYLIYYGLTILMKQFIPIAWIYTAIAKVIGLVVSYLGHNFFSFKEKKDKTSDKDEGKEGTEK